MDRTGSPPTPMERGRPQLNLDELHQLKWLLGGVLALSSVWTVFYVDVDALTLLLATTLAVGAVLWRPGLPDLIPGWLHALAFPVIVVVFGADLWLGGQTLPAMIRLDLMLILYRGISYRQRRDDLQLIVLGLFLVVVTGVLTVSFVFAFQILAFTACALSLLLVITLVDAAEAQDPPVKTPLFTWGITVPRPAWTHQADWRGFFRRLLRTIDWRLAGLWALLFAGVVGVSAVLFVAIPRFQLENSLFLERFISRKARSGFTENVRFGDITDIINDNALALSVDISDPAEVPGTVYLRMVVLDEYREGSFKMSARLRTSSFEAEQSRYKVYGTQPPRRGERVLWTFYFEPGISRFLPVPGSFEILQFRDLQTVAASPLLRLVALKNEPATMTAYLMDRVVTSGTLNDPAFAQVHAVIPRGADGRPLEPDKVQMGLPLGDDDRRVLATAVTTFAGAEAGPGRLSAADFAGKAAAWMAERHTYSLQSTLPSGSGDGLVRWIGGSTPGHCELFAGAFVLLARSAGYPARMIAGFKGGSWNAFTGNLTVHNNDAHAWCEIWDAPTGSWIRVDPTPGSQAVATGDDPKGGAALAHRTDSSWSARLDSLRILWYRRIVNFDQRTQVDAVRSLRDATTAGGQRLQVTLDRTAKAVKDWLTSPWDTGRVLRTAAALVALAGVTWGGRTLAARWRWRRGGLETRGRPDPVRMEAGRWLARLRESEDGTGAASPSISELERLRYGPRAGWPEPRAAFQRARQECKDSRRRKRVGR